jgi:hypothetical protein
MDSQGREMWHLAKRNGAGDRRTGRRVRERDSSAQTAMRRCGRQRCHHDRVREQKPGGLAHLWVGLMSWELK